jgi:hypothetical protein
MLKSRMVYIAGNPIPQALQHHTGRRRTCTGEAGGVEPVPKLVGELTLVVVVPAGKQVRVQTMACNSSQVPSGVDRVV